MKQLEKINAKRRARTRAPWVWLSAVLALATFNSTSYAEQPPAPCFPNPHAARDTALIKNRGDVKFTRTARAADHSHGRPAAQHSSGAGIC
jgi:hypothetical protein